MSNRNNSMVAVGLEVLPGFFFQTFGIGHLYKGRVGMGLGIMLSYWVLQAVNVALCSIFIGFITGPLTWLAYMIAAPTNLLEDGR
ncbi:MAG: TM2 domain-containing membrane protein YozV [Myxococcota bacterium]